MPRQFEIKDAKREMTPLLVGLASPSGAGKTFSALRLAVGIQRVTGGDIFGIDTEGRRMLHYADDFKFKHIPFGPPFRSLDYLDCIRQCASNGARIIIVDSMSHEHEGSGGYLEYHAAEEQRMAGNAAAKFAAWQKPSKERNELIQGLLQLPISFVFCFRAKEKLKPGKDQGKSVMRELGWMPIGGQAFIYEMTVCCLMTPGSNGVPSWDVQNFSPEQQLWIKKPKQFERLFRDAAQLNEGIGEQFAIWANGGNVAANWNQEHVHAAMAGAERKEPESGPDGAEPCPLCKSNIPRCKTCGIELIFAKSDFRRGSTEIYPAFWRCPQKCKDPADKRRNTNIGAKDWHAILIHKTSGPVPPAGSTQSGPAPGDGAFPSEIAPPASIQRGGEEVSHLAPVPNLPPATSLPPTQEPEALLNSPFAEPPGFAELELKELVARYAGVTLAQVTAYVDHNLRGVRQEPERIATVLRAAQKLPTQKLKETILAAQDAGRLML